MSPTSYQAAPPRAFILRNLPLFCNRAYTRHATNLVLIAKDVRNSERVSSLTFKSRDTNGDTRTYNGLSRSQTKSERTPAAATISTHCSTNRGTNQRQRG